MITGTSEFELLCVTGLGTYLDAADEFDCRLKKLYLTDTAELVVSTVCEFPGVFGRISRAEPMAANIVITEQI